MINKKDIHNKTSIRQLENKGVKGVISVEKQTSNYYSIAEWLTK